MISNPILEVSSTSPPKSSSVKSKSSQEGDGSGAFDQFLTREIDRTHPQKQAGRSQVKNKAKEVSTQAADRKYAQTTARSSYSTYAAREEASRDVKSEDTRAAQSTSQTNTQDAASLNAAAAAIANSPATSAEMSSKAASEAAGEVFQAALVALIGGSQDEEPPPEQAQGLGVVAEQPPPQTETPEPARLAEAQPEIQLPKDLVESQTISLQEFQNLLKLKQAGEESAQTMPVEQTQQTGEKTVQAIPVEQIQPAATSLDELQTAAQTEKAATIIQEQVSGTIGQPSTQAQAFLRSLQQYGQIQEVAFSQAADAQGSATVAAEKGTSKATEQTKASELGAPSQPAAAQTKSSVPLVTEQAVQAAAAPEKSSAPRISEQAAQAIAAGSSDSQPVEQASAETGVTQEKAASQDQPAQEVEGEQGLIYAQPKKTHTVDQPAHDVYQTAAVEGTAKVVKATQAKVETAPLSMLENAAASKTSSSAAVQSQSESKNAAGSDLASTNVSQAGDKNPPAAVIDTKTAEATQQSNDIRTVHRVLQQAFNHLDNMAQTGQKTLRVQLYPENLGHLELRLTSQGGSLQVTILADSSVTQEALQQNARDLQQSLQQSGVNLTGLTVGHRGEQEQPSQESNRTYQQQHRTNPQATPEGEIEETDASAASRFTYLNPYSSMEYRI